MIDIGAEFNEAVLAAADVSPVDHDPSTVQIGALPAAGDVTVRVTRILSIPADTVRQLIADHGGPVSQE